MAGENLHTPCILTITPTQHDGVLVNEWHVTDDNSYTRTREFESGDEFLEWINEWWK